MKRLSSPLSGCRFLEQTLKCTMNCRCFAGTTKTDNVHTKGFPNRMSAWQVTSFADGGKIELFKNVPTPIITHPRHVIVKVAYASVNPLDVEMIRECTLNGS